MDKVPLTSSNVPTMFFVGITRTELEKSAKMQFQTLKMAAISQVQGRLRSNSQIICPLPLAISLPSFIGITKIDWEISAKM